MLIRVILAILLFLSALIESTVLPFPFVFLFSALLFIFFEGISSFIIIFFGAVFLDTLTLNHIGFTPIFLFLFFIFIFILENLLISRNSILLGALLIVGLLFYGYLAGYPFSPVLFSITLLSIAAFIIYEKRLEKKGVKYAQR